MAFDVVMPQMGESIAEATVLKWHKQVGDVIAKDDTLYEISTDKVDAEIPAPAAGTLLEILVDVNVTVPVGTVVARIGSASEKPAGAPAPAAAATPAPAAAATAPVAVVPVVLEDDNSLEGRLKSKSSPLVREMAKQHGIDLAKVQGSGQAGRVTKEDLEAYLAKGPAPSAPAAASIAPALPAVHDPSAPTMGLTPALSVAPAPAMPAFAAGERVKVEPMSRMRKIIADGMVASRRTSAHVYTVFEIDMTHVAQLRNKHKKAFEAQFGTKLSFMPFIMMAACKALRAYPVANASVDGDNIVYKQDINLGIAVSLDWGLIVPVVKNADMMNLGGLARSMNDLAERARSKQLKPDEISGGTFTITNPGVYGDTFGLPIINQPQVAIQGVGAIVKRPVVITGPDGTDFIAIRQMMFSSLGFDHRIIDGATGDLFMAFVKKELETSTFGLE
ncbi:dihydrolipoamide acetyltransferase component of pyruvate dehydrogenase complex [Geothrix limicola]|uniref:Dihydrolipoamide acetyltransferase component of pyruvate dehydrogenase complex n=1 Tax=Geothrix limicola TaxID=2927978 RepID=A0ABQ5QDT1_9BACT|nr:dihydrolipoamide acetyltransferase family protein [Geothrix limicola]GLH72600.1 dihydrolipoamide acetyltransferase component of pyruvate dehydrogenase complex [Geothrix limicola]